MKKQLDTVAELDSSFRLAFAQFVAAILEIQLRTFEAADALAIQSIGLAQQHSFPCIGVFSRMALGRARAGLGQAAEGAALIRSEIAGLPDTDRNGITVFLSWLAEAEALDGAIDGALETIERALEANPVERASSCDALRIRAELNRKAGQEQRAEADFRAAIISAQQMLSTGRAEQLQTLIAAPLYICPN